MFKKPSRKDLETLCNLQKAKIRDLRTSLRIRKRSTYKQVEEFLVQYANESKMSYVIIRGVNKIVASTPSFIQRFKFNEEIIGSNCYRILNNPSDELTQKDFEVVFSEHPEEIEKTAVIKDGNGKDRYVVLTKEKPIQFGDEFYTRVQIYEIGTVEGTVKSLKRKLGLNGEAKSLAGFMAREKARRISVEGENKKKQIMGK